MLGGMKDISVVAENEAGNRGHNPLGVGAGKEQGRVRLVQFG